MSFLIFHCYCICSDSSVHRSPGVCGMAIVAESQGSTSRVKDSYLL